ncbi:MAG: FHA domain-containing protein, partial [Candidatus Eremiobacteraeota bacterium]|nr:FHA domain-containing protein [Candidatus Eremiobacteraeota bacterium]
RSGSAQPNRAASNPSPSTALREQPSASGASLAAGLGQAYANPAPRDGQASFANSVVDGVNKVRQGWSDGATGVGHFLGNGLRWVGDTAGKGLELGAKGLGALPAAGLDALGFKGAAQGVRDGAAFVGRQAHGAVGGLGEAAAGLPEGLGHLVGSPITTAKNLGSLALAGSQFTPFGPGLNAVRSLATGKSTKDVVKGDLKLLSDTGKGIVDRYKQTAAKYGVIGGLTHALGDVAGLAIPAAGLARAGKAGQVAKAGQAAEAATTAGRAGKAGEAAATAGRAGEAAATGGRAGEAGTAARAAGEVPHARLVNPAEKAAQPGQAARAGRAQQAAREGEAAAAQAGPHRLIGPDGKSFDLHTSGTRPVGRSAQGPGALKLDSPQVSRNHAALRVEDGKVFVRDLDSANGSFINGQKLKAHEFVEAKPGSEIRFGDQKFKLGEPQPAKAPAPLTGAKRLSAQEGERIAGSAKVPESAARPGPLSNDLTPLKGIDNQFIKEAGLQPRHQLSVGGKDVAFSDPFKAGNYDAVLGYVKDGAGKYNVQPFYRSGSQGIWRAPSHGNVGNGWLGKGVGGEASTNLPIPLQKALNGALEQRPTLKGFDGNRAFYGVQRTSLDDFAAAVKPESLGKFDRELPVAGPKKSSGAPEAFRYHNPQQAPNFSRGPVDSYGFKHPIHGDVKAQVFPSKDGSLQYAFFRNQKNEPWLAQVDAPKSPVNEFGVRQRPIEPGDLANPRLDYADQIPVQYGGSKAQHYTDAGRYVDELPIIKEYRRYLEGAGQ